MVYGTEKVELAAADGQTQTLESTPEHPYWVEGQGWTEASELRPGEQVRTPEGGDLTVVVIQFQYQPTGVIVYNLVVDGDHTYFVEAPGASEAVWVHNAGLCFSKTSQKTIVEPMDVVKVIEKKPANIRAAYEDLLTTLSLGGRGKNQHALAGDRKGQYAADLAGSGKGRGALRLIYELTQNEVIVNEIVDYH